MPRDTAQVHFDTLAIDLTPSSDVTVNLTYSGTDTDGTDFTGVATVNLSANTNSTTFTLDTIDDALAEGAEDIVISIDSVTGGGFEAIAADPASSQVTTTINDAVIVSNCSAVGLPRHIPQGFHRRAEQTLPQTAQADV